VLFFGKSMSRTRCSGALVDALREHGLEVRWRNMATLRRWLGPQLALRWARAEFRQYRPDFVFVFFRDLPSVLLEEFGRQCPTVLWVEEALEVLDSSIVDYLASAHLVCMSNASRYAWLKERGLENLTFLMSGFSPKFHRPAPPQEPRRDVAFIGGPGRRGQRAALLSRISEQFDTQIFGMHWQRWRHLYKNLDVRGTVDNRGYAQICATSRIVLGVNEVNDNDYYFSNRTFLTLACGGFHLTHYVPHLENVFTDGEHLAWFRSEDEAIERIQHWLARPEERARVAAGGHAEVMNHHRYYHRIARILQILRDGRPEPAPQLPQRADPKVVH
jgi:spore maturation protein CgeB